MARHLVGETLARKVVQLEIRPRCRHSLEVPTCVEQSIVDARLLYEQADLGVGQKPLQFHGFWQAQMTPSYRSCERGKV
jgi:hypothetical protein